MPGFDKQVAVGVAASVALIGGALWLSNAVVGRDDASTDQTLAESLGAKLGCVVQESEGENQLFTREDVTCAFGGEDANILTFASDDNKARWLEVAEQFGGLYVEGPDWIVSVEAQSTAQSIAATLDGKVR